jgi:hypothetical protein
VGKREVDAFSKNKKGKKEKEKYIFMYMYGEERKLGSGD